MTLYVRAQFAKYSPRVNPPSTLKVYTTQSILAHGTLKKLRKSLWNPHLSTMS